MMMGNKEPEISMTGGVQAHYEQPINVVTYDEEQSLQEVQAVAVQDERSTTQQHYSYSTQHQNLAAAPSHPSSSISHHHQNTTTTTTTTGNLPLPRGEEDSAEGVGSFDCLLCGESILRNMPPSTSGSLSLIGNTFIDIRDSQQMASSGAQWNVWIVRLIGNVRVLVRPGTKVIVRRFLLCGNRDVHVEEEVRCGGDDDDNNINNTNPTANGGVIRPIPPRFTLTIIALVGNVRVFSDPNE